MERVKKLQRFFNSLESLPIILVFAIILIAFMRTAPGVFTRPRIYMSILSTAPPLLVLGAGLTLVITSGEIDLSFPSVIAFCGMVFANLYKMTGSPLLGFLAAIAVGAFIGYVNGMITTRLNIPSIMTTVGTNFFWGGLTVLLAGGLSLNIPEVREYFLHTLFTGRIGGILPAQAVWAVGVTIFIWFLLNRHVFGEHILFIGDNMNVARVMGVNVEDTKVAVFTFMGLLGGFASVLLTLEMANFWTTQGSGFLLPVVAAVFIGGTSISGGEGRVIGTLFGTFIVGSLEAGVVASGIGGYWTRLTTGLIMLGSIALNVALDKTRVTSGGFAEKLRTSVFVKGIQKNE